ncbi:MAG: hypothetical protein U0401_09320 [Anaerolineae bacterium]
MVQLDHLASRLLRFEQQLAAYQKLHTDELAELWRVLDECKREIAATLSEQRLQESGADTMPANQPDGEQPKQTEVHQKKILNSTSRKDG